VSVPGHVRLVDGVTTLEIVVTPGAVPSLARQPQKDATPQGSATARLARYNPGDFTGDPGAEVLLEVSWDSATAAAGTYPRAVAVSRNLGALFGPWEWQSAPRVTLSGDVVKEVAAVLESLRTSLAAGNPEVLARLADTKLENASRAFPARELGGLRQQIRKVVARDAAQPGWGFAALRPDQFDFRVVGNGRLVECINKDWKPSLRTNVLADGYPKCYPLLLYRVREGWRIAI
jgi:hypothetical protein